MPDWIRILLNMLSQFTGGRGGIDHVIVNYGIAAMFYAIMFAVVKIKYRDDPQPREHLLVWAFAIATARELFMIIMAVIQALGMVTPTKLHAVFPPFKHLLLGLALVLIAAAFLRYLLDDAALTRRYLQLGMGACVLSYAVTSWQWANTLAANPAIVFGKTWYDYLWHANESLWLGIATVILFVRVRGKTRNIVVTALSLYFLFAFLKIPDIALNEVYENIFAPIRVLMYLIAIPILAFVYVQEQSVERRLYLHNLEVLVKQRTLRLQDALLELAASNEKLNELSLTDALTGLGNRRCFDNTLEEEWSRAARDKLPLSLLFIDIDYFKKINDNLGHLAGDAWLKVIANNIAAVLKRTVDTCARYAGDEFAVILPNTPQATVMAVAELIRKNIEQSECEWLDNILRGTISIGVATLTPSNSDEQGAAALIASADGALYLAKERGRNQVAAA